MYQFRINDFYASAKVQSEAKRRPSTPFVRRTFNETATLLRTPTNTQRSQWNDPPAVIQPVPIQPIAINKRKSVQPAAQKLFRSNSSLTVPFQSTQPQATQQQKTNQQSNIFDPNKRVVTGNIEHLMNIAQNFKEKPIIYELYATVLSSGPGKFACEKLVVLRNENGRVLQGVLYEIDLKMPILARGDFVRCVGRILDNRFQIQKISKIIQHSTTQTMFDRLQSLGSHGLKRSYSNHNLKM